MYWKIGQRERDGKLYQVYSYFAIEPKVNFSQPWYSSLTKKIIHPPKYELLIKTAFASNEEAFNKWYEENKQL